MLNYEKTTTRIEARIFSRYYLKEKKEWNLEPCGESGSHRVSKFSTKEHRGSLVGRLGKIVLVVLHFV